MKNILLLLLALLLILVLPACEKDDVSTDAPENNETEQTPDTNDEYLVLPDLNEPITMPEDIFE